MVDASVMVAFYAADDPRRLAATERLIAGDALFAPAHLDAEVVSALRGLARARPALSGAVPRALEHLAGFPLQRMPLSPLLGRMWDLRDNITPDDAAYIALAERLDCPLVTCDTKLARASGPHCTVDVIA